MRINVRRGKNKKTESLIRCSNQDFRKAVYEMEECKTGHKI